jgi:integrase
MARKKQNGNGQGTVYPRKNKQGKIIGYRGSYYAPDGKRRYVSAKRKGDAKRALRQAMTDADRGFVFDGETLTLEDYLTCWLIDSVKDTVRRSTYAQYESVVNRHIIPALGRLTLKSITPAHAPFIVRSWTVGSRPAQSSTSTSRSTRRSSRQ